MAEDEEEPLGGWLRRRSHTLAVADKKGVKCRNRGTTHSAKMSQWAHSLLYCHCFCYSLVVGESFKGE